MELTFHNKYFFRLIHSYEFRGKLNDNVFSNTTYPWEIYQGTFHQLGDAYYERNRALLFENEQPFADDTFYDPALCMIIIFYAY